MRGIDCGIGKIVKAADNLKQGPCKDGGMPPEIDFPPGARIFLTGGTGFFGKLLLKAFGGLNAGAGGGCEVLVLSRDPARFVRRFPEWAGQPWLSFVRGDITSFDFPAGAFSHVIHAATDTGMEAMRDPLALFGQIVGGTRRALEFAAEKGVGKFLLTSSGAVYGPQPPDMERIPETYLGAPSTTDINGLYGQAKRAAEQLCTVYRQQHALDVRIARCFAFAGEHLPLTAHFALGNFVHDALFADAIRVKGDGAPIRSYLAGDDLAVWLLTILERGKPGQPYNVGSDQAISMADLAALVGATLAPGKPVVLENARPDYAARSRYIPDIGRARDELGLDVWTGLRHAVAGMGRAASGGADGAG